jgi:hypothetical protein
MRLLRPHLPSVIDHSLPETNTPALVRNNYVRARVAAGPKAGAERVADMSFDSGQCLLPEGFRSMIRTIGTDSRLHNLLLLVFANPKEIIYVQTDPLGYDLEPFQVKFQHSDLPFPIRRR